jgi:hypothetical protein
MRRAHHGAANVDGGHAFALPSANPPYALFPDHACRGGQGKKVLVRDW